MIPIEFSKYHGTGNDFIVVNNCNGQIQPTQEEIAGLCRRHFGIGADGFILVEPSEEADVKMVYFNADGSPAVMCGNGIRCFAKYVFDKGLVDTRSFDVETAAGIKHIEIMDDGKPVANRIRVDMGAPIFDKDRIGVEMNVDPVLDQTLDTTLGPVLFSAVSMGNPHAIIEVSDVENHPVMNWGPVVETHPVFTNGANVNFVQVVDRDNCRVVTWERGSGLTLACGTGSCAAAALLHKKGLVNDTVTVHIPGGVLTIELGETVIMTGPAVWVFDGSTESDKEEDR